MFIGIYAEVDMRWTPRMPAERGERRVARQTEARAGRGASTAGRRPVLALRQAGGPAREAIRALEDLSSPMSAFLRDRCVLGRDLRVSVDDLWADWKDWCDDQSHHHGTKQTFGRDLRAAVP